MYEKIKNTMDSVLKQNNIENTVTLSYGSIKGIPEELAVFRKKLGWYYYISDDRNNGYYTGPYDFNALILKLCNKLHLSNDYHEKIRSKYRSQKMDDFYYCDNELFRTEEEIDLYEAEHPEKKVE